MFSDDSLIRLQEAMSRSVPPAPRYPWLNPDNGRVKALEAENARLREARNAAYLDGLTQGRANVLDEIRLFGKPIPDQEEA